MAQFEEGLTVARQVCQYRLDTQDIQRPRPWAKVDGDYRAVCALEPDPEAFLRALKEFEAKYPPLADFLPAASIKLALLLNMQGKAGQAKEYADALVAKAIKQHNGLVLDTAYSFLRHHNKSKELAVLGVRAAEALLCFSGGNEPHSLPSVGGRLFRQRRQGQSEGVGPTAVPLRPATFIGPEEVHPSGIQ